jgi:hypothetical protein
MPEAYKLDSVASQRGSLGSEVTPVQQKPKKEKRVGRIIIGEVHESGTGAPQEQEIILKGGVERPNVGTKRYERWKKERMRRGLPYFSGQNE